MVVGCWWGVSHVKFDSKAFLKEAGAFLLIAIFVFALSAISLFSQVSSSVLASVSMEPAGYVGYCDAHYGASNRASLLQVISDIETSPAETYRERIYVLDKETGEVISTGNVAEEVTEELNRQVNEKLIVIDGRACKVTDYDHYKVLVQADLTSLYGQYLLEFGVLAFSMVQTALIALMLLAAAHRFSAAGSHPRLVAGIALMLFVVGSFAGETLYVENRLTDNIVESEKQTLVADLKYLCENHGSFEAFGKEDLLEVGNNIAEASVTLAGVGAPEGAAAGTQTEADAATTAAQAEADAAAQGEVSSDGRAPDAEPSAEFVDSLTITLNEDAIANQKRSCYIQAALMFLLAAILLHEYHKASRARLALAAKSQLAELAPTDRRMRSVLLLNGICMSAFSIVNVLRIRQVVMLRWENDPAGFISAIFTVTMLAGVLGSFLSSTVLRKCGSVKGYAIFVLLVGIVGAIGCGASQNLAVFVVGLMLFNLARSQMMMIGDFYTTLIDDAARKDYCQVEFASGESIGQVVGNIAGGVISTVVSYGFVQIVSGVLMALSVLVCLRFSANELAVRGGACARATKSIGSVIGLMRHGSVFVYVACILLPDSVAYMLVQYKLPLDVAALGMSTVVLSFAKTMQKVVRVYANPLYHVIGRHLSPAAHLVLFVVLDGLVVLAYLLSSSIVGLVVCVAGLGLVNGMGYYATTKMFREMPVLASVPEADRMVGLNLGRRAGDAVAPTLLTAFSHGVALPLMIMVAPFVYLVDLKRAER
jgi:hypothetical protein